MKTASAPTVTVRDKSFRVYLTRAQIAEQVAALGARIAADYDRPPILVCVLKGSYIFAADLQRAIGKPTEIDFIKVTSYRGTESAGHITYQLKPSANLTGRDVIVVEDILDTGATLFRVMSDLEQHNPASLEIATLLHKAEATQYSIHPKYTGFVIPNHFVLGYGLDYDELGRELPDIYTLNE